MLTLPKVLRYLLAYDGKLCRAVAKAAMQEVFRFQRLQARRALGLGSTKLAHTGAMVAVQRFGSALNLNILGVCRWVSAKHLSRYLAEFQWRFNRRFDLSSILQRLLHAAVLTPPLPQPLLLLAERSR